MGISSPPRHTLIISNICGGYITDLIAVCVPSECQQSALGGAVVCLLKGRGEGERERANGGREGGRGTTAERDTERGGEREQGRKLFTSEQARRKRVCVCACWSGDHAGKKKTQHTHIHNTH